MGVGGESRNCVRYVESACLAFSYCRNSNYARSHILAIKLYRAKGDFKILSCMSIH